VRVGERQPYTSLIKLSLCHHIIRHIDGYLVALNAVLGRNNRLIPLPFSTIVGRTRDFQNVGYVHVGSEVFIRAGAH
jgi:hypothetical protein